MFEVKNPSVPKALYSRSFYSPGLYENICVIDYCWLYPSAYAAFPQYQEHSSMVNRIISEIRNKRSQDATHQEILHLKRELVAYCAQHYKPEVQDETLALLDFHTRLLKPYGIVIGRRSESLIFCPFNQDCLNFLEKNDFMQEKLPHYCKFVVDFHNFCVILKDGSSACARYANVNGRFILKCNTRHMRDDDRENIYSLLRKFSDGEKPLIEIERMLFSRAKK
jgi:hypothetical protein